MLEDLERGVDHSDAKLTTAMRKMRKFIRQTEGKPIPFCTSIALMDLLLQKRSLAGALWF